MDVSEKTPVSKVDIIFIFQAHNRGEFDTDELIRRLREWTEAMLKLYEQQEPIEQD